jgi:hypothetical protein
MIRRVAARSGRVIVGVVALLLLGSAAATAVAGRSSVRSLPRSALVPNAVAFLNQAQGVLGTGWTSCVNSAFHCRPEGTISLSSDGGKTWRVVRRTPRPVVSILRYGYGHVVDAVYDDGETLRSGDGGRTWQTGLALPYGFSACPEGMATATNTQPVGTHIWALCTTEASAGNQGKEVFRLGPHGWKPVACTGFAASRCSYGGISAYGYPQGIAATRRGGFALIWETRGTLYVTRNGGRHWIALPRSLGPRPTSAGGPPSCRTESASSSLPPERRRSGD